MGNLESKLTQKLSTILAPGGLFTIGRGIAAMGQRGPRLKHRFFHASIPHFNDYAASMIFGAIFSH
jgi:hypothetical protein